MGYTTKFQGSFTITPSLTAQQVAVLTEFSETRHEDAEFPSIWCDWCPSVNGTSLAWNQSEKTYETCAWIKYLIEHFFNPWGCTLNGHVRWQGEVVGDAGIITVIDNVLTTKVFDNG